MATSTLENIKAVFTTSGTKQVIHKVTANGLTVEKVVEVVVKPAPVPVITDTNSPFGFAAEGGVTGGAGGDTVVVTDYNGLKAALGSLSPKIIHWKGAIYGNGPTSYMLYGKPNKTIIGVPGTGAKAVGFGLGWWPKDANKRSNVIIRNIEHEKMFDSGDIKAQRDFLVFKGGSEGHWVDHCTYQPGPQDGHIDMSTDCKYTTFSHLKMLAEDKAMLQGGGSVTNGVTYAYLWQIDVTERGPDFGEGFGHMISCFSESINSSFLAGYGVGLRDAQTEMLLTNCLWKNFKGHPLRLFNRTDLVTGLPLGIGKFGGIETCGFINSGTNQLTGQVASTKQPVYDYSTLGIPLSQVEAYVKANAGSGKLTLAQLGMA